jgi:inorganic pyrophosphatase
MSLDNLFHQTPPGPNPPKVIYCLVEIPKGSSNKYEYSLEFGAFILDRPLYSAVFFPTEYGIIPQSWAKDGDPLDVMVVSSFSTFSGCLLACRPIGVLKLNDSGSPDNKILAVPTSDPRFSEVHDLGDLSPHFKKEICNFWENYSELQPNKKIKIKGWGNKELAWKTINKALAFYREKFR